MSVTSVDTDYQRLTVTVIADFDATVDQVWELWSDPRKLECWWGPPAYPATFERHDLVPGGEVMYSMTGPDGNRHRGVWRVTVVEPPASLGFTDAIADEEGKMIEGAPVSTVCVRLAERESGTRMEMRSTFESREALEAWLSTGTREGLQEAIAQMDALLEDE